MKISSKALISLNTTKRIVCIQEIFDRSYWVRLSLPPLDLRMLHHMFSWFMITAVKNSQELFLKIFSPVITNLVPKEQAFSFHSIFFLWAPAIWSITSWCCILNSIPESFQPSNLCSSISQNVGYTCSQLTQGANSLATLDPESAISNRSPLILMHTKIWESLFYGLYSLEMKIVPVSGSPLPAKQAESRAPWLWPSRADCCRESTQGSSPVPGTQ